MPTAKPATIQALIIDLIRTKLDVELKGEGYDGSTPLFEGGLELDSFDIVELISQLETVYSIDFSEQDFQPEHFATLGTLSLMLERYIDKDRLDS